MIRALIFFILILSSCDQRTTEIPEEYRDPKSQFRSKELKKELVYQAPKGWIREKPLNQMRKDQFRLPGDKKGDDALLSVFLFPGMEGKVQDNLDRWKNQFIIDPKKDRSEIKHSRVNNMNVTDIFIEGGFDLSKLPPSIKQDRVLDDFALYGFVVESPQGPWFFKAVGPKETINKWQSSFVLFKKSLKLR